ncbi:MAG: hypothetical protein ACLVJ6_01200 [Merdibacter sp.]
MAAVDATLGRGHSEILKRRPNGHLYALTAIRGRSSKAARARRPSAATSHSRFSLMKEELAQRGVTRVDGILMYLAFPVRSLMRHPAGSIVLMPCRYADATSRWMRTVVNILMKTCAGAVRIGKNRCQGDRQRD